MVVLSGLITLNWFLKTNPNLICLHNSYNMIREILILFFEGHINVNLQTYTDLQKF